MKATFGSNGQQAAVSDLLPGECFFFSTPEERRQQEHDLLSMIARLAEEGLEELTGEERMAFYRASAVGYIVEAIVKETGERCTVRLSDGKRHVWCCSAIFFFAFRCNSSCISKALRSGECCTIALPSYSGWLISQWITNCTAASSTQARYERQSRWCSKCRIATTPNVKSKLLHWQKRKRMRDGRQV